MSEVRTPHEGTAERLDFGLPDATAEGRARRAAFALPSTRARTPTSLVEYRSGGRLLIIGPGPYARSIAESVDAALECTVLALAPAGAPGSQEAEPMPAAASGEAARDVPVFHARSATVAGHLGRFTVTARTGDREIDLAGALGPGLEHFDLVLDLCAAPHVRCDLPPPGYFAPGRDEAALHRALAEIPQMVGEFQKPRYFHYNPDICAHGSSGLRGCTRCLDACPTGAITSIGERVSVDPYLCQGGGTCAAACPTGAMTYAYPRVDELLEGVRHLLKAYREAGGRDACVLFFGAERGREWLARVAAQMPERVLPVEVEEVGSVGMDAWLAVLAYGASEVAMLCPAGTPPTVLGELRAQASYTRPILEGMGYAGERLRLVEAADEEAVLAELRGMSRQPQITPAGFAAQDEKRTTLRLALEHLAQQAPQPAAEVSLPRGAPFGEIVLDVDACTLCMACVSVCPAAALEAGGETPMLRFIEWNCVQCGLCASACPERAVTLSPRLLFDAGERRAARSLKEEEPFRCVSCGKPFATRSVMKRMREKLAGHWMFRDPLSLRRLEMCEDCRVQDMFDRGGGMIDPHRDS